MPESKSSGAPGPAPIEEPCTGCGAMLDVSAAKPLDEVTCHLCGAVMQARRRIKDYLIESVLGVGGMGKVYRAYDGNLNRHLALKVVSPEFSGDAGHRKKFEEEARVTAQVNHPNVVKVYAFGSDSGLFYIAMELAEGGDLDDLMTSKGRLGEEKVLEMGIQIAEGLRAAYARGLIHRDIKPGNILFSNTGAKIVDFGLACLAGAGPHEHGEVWGTPYYLAPEKLHHKTEDFRGDIYSLGASLFHAIAGRPPHHAETISLEALKEIKGRPVDLREAAPEVSDATAAAINRMLQANPRRRFQSYDDLIGHLTYALGKLRNKGGESELPPRFDSSRMGSLLRTWRGIAATVSAVILLVAACYFAFRGGPSKKEGVPVVVKREAEGPEKTFAKARQLIAGGRYVDAGRLLSQLAGTPNLPQPLGRWIILHQGLNSLLLGDLETARGEFKKLQESGLYSMSADDSALANFFVETGRVVSEGTVVSSSEAEAGNFGDCETLGLFIDAMLDWQISQFDEARGFLNVFLKASPQAPYEWVSDYKVLARKYLVSLDACQQAEGHLEAAGTLAQKNAVLQELRELANPPTIPGKLQDKMKALAGRLEKRMAEEKLAEKLAVKKSTEQQASELQAAEKKLSAQLEAEMEMETQALAAAKKKAASLADNWQFEEAAGVFQSLQLSVGQLDTERGNLFKRAQWLMQFKAILIDNLKASGYSQPVYKRAGGVVAGRVGGATRTSVEMQTPYGAVVVSWNELAPATILAMANYFMPKGAVPDVIADRMWLSGVYACHAGLQQEGEAILTKAAGLKAAYQEQLPLFTGTSAR